MYLDEVLLVGGGPALEGVVDDRDVAEAHLAREELAQRVRERLVCKCQPRGVCRVWRETCEYSTD